MPNPRWRPQCDCHGVGTRLGTPSCRKCGRPGTFLGVDKSVVEHWCAFQRVTGLNPLGPKTSPEAQTIVARIVTCGLCGGSGCMSGGPDAWSYCPRCLGDGIALDGRFKGAGEKQ